MLPRIAQPSPHRVLPTSTLVELGLSLYLQGTAGIAAVLGQSLHPCPHQVTHALWPQVVLPGSSPPRPCLFPRPSLDPQPVHASSQHPRSPLVLWPTLTQGRDRGSLLWTPRHRPAHPAHTTAPPLASWAPGPGLSPKDPMPSEMRPYQAGLTPLQGPAGLS